MSWISVEERLPECDEKYGVSKIVLCLDYMGRIGFGIYVSDKQLYDKGWFSGGGVGEGSIKITHWMPIPEKPQK